MYCTSNHKNNGLITPISIPWYILLDLYFYKGARESNIKKSSDFYDIKPCLYQYTILFISGKSTEIWHQNNSATHWELNYIIAS